MSNVITINGYTIRYPGKIISIRTGRKKVYLLDQLDTWDGMENPDNPEELTFDNNEFIFSSSFPNYIKKYYDLDPIEYYGLIVHGDRNYRHICDNPDCNNQTRFNSILAGYSSFCSYTCNANYYYSNEDFVKYRNEIFNSEDHRRLMSDLAYSNWESESYRKNQTNSHILT